MPTVVVIDDERHIRERYAMELSDAGFDVVTVAACRDLLRRIEEARPDAILLDIRMVDCDGLEMLGRIRERHRDLPVIICSAYDSYRSDPRAMAADYYVIKSYDLAPLIDKLDRALQGSASLSVRTGREDLRSVCPATA